MDKKTFIKELEQALSVLQEEELKDIISEYEQHIDMKQERGLTEEEAIADFGSLDELATEILEAYHVRADYGMEKKYRQGIFRKGFRKIFGQGKSWGLRLWVFIFAGVQQLGNILLRIGMFWKQLGSRFWKKLVGFAGNRKNYDLLHKEESAMGTEKKIINKETWKETQNSDVAEIKKISKIGRFWGTVFHGTANLVKEMIYLCSRIFRWGIRMTWNAGCLGFSFCCGFFGLICLYGFGLLMVLLLQGYPLVGLTMGCLGLVMCTFSAACLGLTMLWRVRKNTEASQRAYQEPEGDQHA
ncbi:MAG: DUF1700 domain-containing protein [Lachnospiraceae bacterium]|jgi:hypothetical protein|nr:DUF1700 domain-containing protein [Lachnospiraceae bacterium]